MVGLEPHFGFVPTADVRTHPRIAGAVHASDLGHLMPLATQLVRSDTGSDDALLA